MHGQLTAALQLLRQRFDELEATIEADQHSASQAVEALKQLRIQLQGAEDELAFEHQSVAALQHANNDLKLLVVCPSASVHHTFAQTPEGPVARHRAARRWMAGREFMPRRSLSAAQKELAEKDELIAQQQREQRQSLTDISSLKADVAKVRVNANPALATKPAVPILGAQQQRHCA